MGSPATLLANLLRERDFKVHMYDPYIDAGVCPFDWAGIYFVATKHRDFGEPNGWFPAGSVVIDPWRYIPQQEGVEVVHLGVGDSLGLFDETAESVRPKPFPLKGIALPFHSDQQT